MVFRLLSREIFSISTILFVVVPIVMSMNGPMTPQNMLYSAQSQIESAASSLPGMASQLIASLPAPSLPTGGLNIGSGSSLYVSSSPIYLR